MQGETSHETCKLALPNRSQGRTRRRVVADRPTDPLSEQPYRVVPQSAIDKVAVSITQFGFRQPIVVDEQAFVIVGHTRLLAAKQLALAEVPVHVACDLRTAFTMKG